MSQAFDFERYICAQARRVSRTCGLDQDDVEQELRLCYLQNVGKPDPVKTLAIKRQCIDLMRVECNRRKHFVDMTSWNDRLPQHRGKPRDIMDMIDTDERREILCGNRTVDDSETAELRFATDDQEIAVRTILETGNRTEAAQKLGISYGALSERVRRFQRSCVERRNCIDSNYQDDINAQLEQREWTQPNSSQTNRTTRTTHEVDASS